MILVAHSEGAAVVRRSLCDLGIEFAEEIQSALDPNYRKLEVADIDDLSDAIVVMRGATLLRQQNPQTPAAPSETVLAYSQRVKAEALRVLSTAHFQPLSAELKLFAPAHCGSLITGKLRTLLELLRGLYSLCLGMSIAAAELETKSGIITSLKSESEELAAAYPYLSSFRADILWGEHDGIVDKQKFRFDRFDLVPGHNHTTVCKPQGDYLLPFAFVQHEPYAGSATV